MYNCHEQLTPVAPHSNAKDAGTVRGVLFSQRETKSGAHWSEADRLSAAHASSPTPAVLDMPGSDHFRSDVHDRRIRLDAGGSSDLLGVIDCILQTEEKGFFSDIRLHRLRGRFGIDTLDAD